MAVGGEKRTGARQERGPGGDARPCAARPMRRGDGMRARGVARAALLISLCRVLCGHASPPRGRAPPRAMGARFALRGGGRDEGAGADGPDMLDMQRGYAHEAVGALAMGSAGADLAMDDHHAAFLGEEREAGGVGPGVGRADLGGTGSAVTIPGDAPSLRAALRATERKQGVPAAGDADAHEDGYASRDKDEGGPSYGIDNVWTVYKVVQRVHPDHTPMPGMEDSKLQIRTWSHVVCTPGVAIREGPIHLLADSRGSIGGAKLFQRISYTLTIQGAPWVVESCEVRNIGGAAVRMEGRAEARFLECAVGGEGPGDDRTRDSFWLQGQALLFLQSCRVEHTSLIGVVLWEDAQCKINGCLLQSGKAAVDLNNRAIAHVCASRIEDVQQGAFWARPSGDEPVQTELVVLDCQIRGDMWWGNGRPKKVQDAGNMVIGAETREEGAKVWEDVRDVHLRSVEAGVGLGDVSDTMPVAEDDDGEGGRERDAMVMHPQDGAAAAEGEDCRPAYHGVAQTAEEDAWRRVTVPLDDEAMDGAWVGCFVLCVFTLCNHLSSCFSCFLVLAMNGQGWNGVCVCVCVCVCVWSFHAWRCAYVHSFAACTTTGPPLMERGIEWSPLDVFLCARVCVCSRVRACLRVRMRRRWRKERPRPSR